MNYKHLTLSALTATLLLSGAHQAQAAGFYIQEQSVKGLGTAFAGSTTSIDDASTVYFNPAGMTKLERMQLNIGVDLLAPDAKLTNTGTTAPPGQAVGIATGNPYEVTPVPHAFAVAPLEGLTGLPLWAGIGITAPFGLGSDYTDGYFARYDSTDTKLETINISPSIAYKATEWLSLGFGFDIQHADAKLKSSAFVGAGVEAESQLKGDDWSYGYNIGIQAKPLPKTEIGLHYRSAMKHELEGQISLQGTGLGALADFNEGGSADLNLPDIATLGVAHDLTPETRLMAQATWFGWTHFKEIRPIRDSGGPAATVTQNYENTWAFAIGAEHDLNEKFTIRGGYQFDATPTNDQFRTTRTPDGDRNWFSGGATYKLNENIDLDFAATYIDVSKEKINVTRNNLNPALAGNVRANSEGNVKIFSAGLSYKF